MAHQCFVKVLHNKHIPTVAYQNSKTRDVIYLCATHAAIFEIIGYDKFIERYVVKVVSA